MATAAPTLTPAGAFNNFASNTFVQADHEQRMAAYANDIAQAAVIIQSTAAKVLAEYRDHVDDDFVYVNTEDAPHKERVAAGAKRIGEWARSIAAETLSMKLEY